MIIIFEDGFGKVNGLDGGGVLNYQNPKSGGLWDLIRTWNNEETTIGNVYWSNR